jgi:ankyrin repeat protein
MGETALYQASEMENVDQVITLLKNKANPNIPQQDGLIPLHIAIEKKNVQIVEELLQYGSNPNQKNKHYNQTPVHYAFKFNSKPDILMLLIQYGGKLGIKDKNNQRPVDYECSNEMLEAVEKLKQQRDDVFKTPTKNNSGSPKKTNTPKVNETEPIYVDNRVFTLENHFDSFITKEIPLSERNPLDTIKYYNLN